MKRSGEESSSSSEDEEEFQCQILEKERDEATQKLFEIEHVSAQLLKEMDALETQFQIERSCRESAEAFAVKMTKENKVLKRRSQALLPLIPELPENLDALTFDLQNDLVPEEDSDVSIVSVLQWQCQVRDLQSSLDQLLGEKIQLSDQVETLKREQSELKEQLAVEVEEREALLRRLNKQSRTLHKVKRVSQLATQEFNDITQRLQLEKGLRQHAETFAHQMLLKQREAQRLSMSLVQSTESGPQLQQALEQVAHISSALEEIRLQHQNQVLQTQAALEETSMLSELQSVRAQLERREGERRAMEAQLERSEGERRAMETQLSDAQHSVTELQEEGQPSSDIKSRAVDEMMERIKKGIVLRPTQRPQQESVKRPGFRRGASRKRISRHVGEVELQTVLQRRRRAMGDEQACPTPPKSPDPQSPSPANSTLPWAGESSTPVLRRLKQNREKRNSRVTASEYVIWGNS
ncbi:hypothetical protein SKAU_G00029240 [Synaphobranchus kaupii]|uniref:Shootin-1 n=1 Tax=Synaphobranchus kaupii TaxID=118154 RepID=A0A9Q1GEL8_SYNKA|nr:hypothetical protein SKAU_G00029240 [Synaphobranchus kaupii]